MFDHEDWYEIESKFFKMNRLVNPMAKINGHKWGVTKQQSNVSLLKDFVEKSIQHFTTEHLQRPKIAIITKLNVEQQLKTGLFQYTKDNTVRFVHFNKGRGTNKLEDEDNPLDLAILYGRFGFTPLDREMYYKIGFDTDQINAIELSEWNQCLHRARPLLHPNLPFLFFTDRDFLNTMFNLNKIKSYPLSVIEHFTHNPSISNIERRKDLMAFCNIDDKVGSSLRSFLAWYNAHFFH
jgi:hypothetical protein